MLDPGLVEAITEQVLAELRAATPRSTLKEAKPGQRRVLLCPGPASVDDSVWQALASVDGLAWQAVVWDGFRADQFRLPGRTIPAPTSWESAVASVEAIVLPSVDLGGLAAIANLLTVNPPAAAAVQGVVQGRPVYLCSESLEVFRRHANRIPQGLLKVFAEHRATVESFGVQILESSRVAAALKGEVRTPVAPSSGGRDVVTTEDLEALQRKGQKVLQVASGAIVTPLARQAATRMGIEVRFI